MLVALLGATGFLLVKVVGDASLYFYNADEAVAKKAELGDRQFRIQGTYVGKASEQDDGTIALRHRVQRRRVAVEHSGSRAGAVQAGHPGRARGAVVAGRVDVPLGPHRGEARRGVPRGEPRPGPRGRTVNAALGRGGVVLAFVSALGGIGLVALRAAPPGSGGSSSR